MGECRHHDYGMYLQLRPGGPGRSGLRPARLANPQSDPVDPLLCRLPDLLVGEGRGIFPRGKYLWKGGPPSPHPPGWPQAPRCQEQCKAVTGTETLPGTQFGDSEFQDGHFSQSSEPTGLWACSGGHCPPPPAPTLAPAPRRFPASHPHHLWGPWAVPVREDQHRMWKDVVVTITLVTTKLSEVWKYLLGWGPEEETLEKQTQIHVHM